MKSIYSDEQIASMRQYMIDNPRVSQQQVSQITGVSKHRVTAMSKQLREEGYDRQSLLPVKCRKAMCQELWDIHNTNKNKANHKTLQEGLANKYGLSSVGSMRQIARNYVAVFTIHEKLTDYLASEGRDLIEKPKKLAKASPKHSLASKAWDSNITIDAMMFESSCMAMRKESVGG